jgi:hypothetical protein
VKGKHEMIETNYGPFGEPVSFVVYAPDERPCIKAEKTTYEEDVKASRDMNEYLRRLALNETPT